MKFQFEVQVCFRHRCGWYLAILIPKVCFHLIAKWNNRPAATHIWYLLKVNFAVQPGITYVMTCVLVGLMFSPYSLLQLQI